MHDAVPGLAAVILGGVCNGSFIFPMKLVRHWRWEHIWFVFALLGLAVLPTAIAFWGVPDLLGVYRVAGASVVLAAALLGLAWGTGSLLFGLSVAVVGMSLGYAIVMGTTTVLGTLVPALVLEPGVLSTRRGLALVASLLAVVSGLALCAGAGYQRDRASAKAPTDARRKFVRGLLLCLASGTFSACFNIGFALTGGIARTAESFGANPADAGFAIWAPIMLAGFLPSLVYCGRLIIQHRSVGVFRLQTRNWLYGAGMAGLWIISVRLYGSGAAVVGPAIAWPALMSITILTANALGLLSGEWSGLGWRMLMRLLLGLLVLLGAVLLAGMAA